MKKRKSHTKQIILLLLSIEILVVIGLLAYIQLRPMVVEAVTLEAGSKVLAVEEFLLYENRKGSFITDMEALNLSKPGTYEIEIKVGNRIHTSDLKIIDTVAPTGKVNDIMALKDEIVEAASFVTEVEDATEVIITYKEKPDTSIPGEKDIILILEDSSGNRTELNAKLTILDIKNAVQIEAGSVMNITPKDFVTNDKYDVSFITDLTTLDISKPTTHRIELSVNGRVVNGNIEVVDTTAPIATFSNQTVWKDEVINADAFVTNIIDTSGVTAEYLTPPDFTKIGEKLISVLLRDDYGNETIQSVKLTVKEDTIPPKIMGTKNKTVYIGDGAAYRKGVYVTDNKDQELEFSVDSSAVNLKKKGTYNVIYSAKDLAGNTTTVTTTVTVKEFIVTQEMVDELTDQVLDKIIKNNMTKLEKADAIYRWIKKNVGYTGDSDKTNWLAEAYRAIKKGEGDCFTYYAVAQALLTRAGIDNMQVTRLGGKTRHYWNLVNCGDGWYHFDSCPNRDHEETFMLTDAELEKFDKTRGSYYYNRDKSLYPATPEE